MALLLRTVLVSMALAASQAPVAAAPGGAAGEPAAATSSLTALKSLEPGLWQLETPGRAPRQMCVADTAALIQLEHDQPGCSRLVVTNEPKNATVQYNCPRGGWGRTTVRSETASAAVIRTQGISRNAPFDYLFEARRVGTCGAQVVVKQR
ncbi:MAG: hypothetical protein EON57_01365 [Alphaproteobacteria bacterium]|nr:MAG: hypothetical protein EON57_01365 [Alphaproteobacteria bacterium]